MLEIEDLGSDVSDRVHAAIMHECINHAREIMRERILSYANADIASSAMNTAKMTAEIRAAGWTQSQIGEFCGVSQTTVGRWEKGTDPEGPSRDKLAELYEQVIGKPAKPYSTFDPDVPDVPEVRFDDNGVALVDGKVVFKGRLPGSAPETIAAGGLGNGKMDGMVAQVQTKGVASGHTVAAEWVIPPSFLRHGLGGRPDTTIIVPVIGHSMEPRLYEGDRVIVDVAQNTWVADAIYAIAFDDENFQVKTVKVDRTAETKTFRIISEAFPGDEVRLKPDDFRIVGRVVGRISRP